MIDKVAKTAIDIARDKEIQNNVSGVFSKLFPYFGITKRAVDDYINEIEKSNLSADIKAFFILNTPKAIKWIKNQQSIADIAVNNAVEGTDFSEKSDVSDDFVDRFMDAARFVSSEDVQIIWGKILAKEFEKPGSTPPNMIRVLSEMTPTLANAFTIICGMTIQMLPVLESGKIEMNNVIRRVCIPYSACSDEYLEMGVSFGILSELDTLGLIKFNMASEYAIKDITSQEVLVRIGEEVKLVGNNWKDNFPIGNVMLTSVGNTLLKIISSEVPEKYYDIIMKYFDKSPYIKMLENRYEVNFDGEDVRSMFVKE